MDTSTLRWILIVVGALVIGAVWLLSTMEKNRKPKATRREKASKKRIEGAVRREPTLDNVSASSDMETVEPGGQGELNISPADEQQAAPAAAKQPPRPRRPAGPPPDKIVTLFLLARDNHRINGAELLQAAVNTGMEFGDMNIFHRLPEGEEKSVFSLANAEKPGYFERDEWNTFETNGVVLFLTLPGPQDALSAWDAMLATGRRMAEILHAELLDDERSPFTRQREAQVREEMRGYDREKGTSS